MADLASKPLLDWVENSRAGVSSPCTALTRLLPPGITGIARRLVLDGSLEEAAARKAMEAATAEKQPLATYLVERRLVSAAALAAANSIEFGMPLVDALAIDPTQSAIALVKEELLRKHPDIKGFQGGFEHPLEVGKVEQQLCFRVQALAFNRHFDAVVVAVQPLAFALIMPQGVGRAKFVANGKSPE